MSATPDEYIAVCIIAFFLSMMRWYLTILCNAQPGDIVAIKHGIYGRKEGLVIGSHIDYAVRAQIIPFLLRLILIERFSVDYRADK
jgi:hypothetical protein